MSNRTLYLFSYDVRCPRRLYRVGRYLRGFRVGGQKSVYELWLTAAEFDKVLAHVRTLLDEDEDRLHALALDPRMKTRCLGVATNFNRSHFTIV